jgi:hypothetical protein
MIRVVCRCIDSVPKEGLKTARHFNAEVLVQATKSPAGTADVFGRPCWTCNFINDIPGVETPVYCRFVSLRRGAGVLNEDEDDDEDDLDGVGLHKEGRKRGTESFS